MDSMLTVNIQEAGDQSRTERVQTYLAQHIAGVTL